VRAGPFFRAAPEDQDVHRKQRALYRDYLAGCDRAERLARVWSRASAPVAAVDER
jgi:hypothetical protein